MPQFPCPPLPPPPPREMEAMSTLCCHSPPSPRGPSLRASAPPSRCPSCRMSCASVSPGSPPASPPALAPALPLLPLLPSCGQSSGNGGASWRRSANVKTNASQTVAKYAAAMRTDSLPQGRSGSSTLSCDRECAPTCPTPGTNSQQPKQIGTPKLTPESFGITLRRGPPPSPKIRHQCSQLASACFQEPLHQNDGRFSSQLQKMNAYSAGK